MLIKIENHWVVGDRDSLQLVKKAGKQFFFDARINAHHSDVQDMLTRISLAQLFYSQQHNGLFADLATLITAGLVPKDLEGIESTGYRFHINSLNGGKSWNASAEPAQYGRTGKLSFYMDAAGVRSADKPGELEGVRTDSGIVFAENRPYLISVMTTYLHNEQAGEEAIARISMAAYSMFDRMGRASEYGRVVSKSNGGKAR